MDAVVLGALAGILFGLYTVLVRVGMRHGGVPEAGALVATSIALPLVAAAALATGDLARASLGEVWPFLLIGMAVPGLSQYAFVGAVRHAGAARAAVLIGCAPLLGAAIAIVALGEPFRWLLVAGTVLIVAGCGSLAWEGSRPEGFRILGVVLALACALLFALRDNAVRLASEHVSAPALAAALASLAGAEVSLVTSQALLRRGALASDLRRSLRPFLVAGATLGAAYTCLIEALAHGKVTVVGPLNATQALWGVVASVLLLGATERVGPRLVAAGLLVVLGGALVGVSR